MVIAALTSLAITTLVFADWVAALLGGIAVIVLSCLENEPFILTLIFLSPVGWLLNVHAPVKNVLVAVRIVVVAVFFLSRMWCGPWDGSRIFRSPITKASLLFFFVAFVSCPLGGVGWSHESLRSLYDLASYVGFFLMLLVWVDSRRQLRKVLSVLLCSTMLAAAFAIIQEIAGGYTALWTSLSPSGEDVETWSGRAPSFLNYANSLAGYLNLILPLALAVCVLMKGRWRKLGAWTLALGTVALLSTQSIGGLGAFAAILVLAIFCFVATPQKRLLYLGGMCGAFCVLFLLKHALNPAHTQDSFGPDAAIRLLLWDTAWNLFLHSPTIGVGWGNFTGLYESYVQAFSSLIPPGVFAIHNIYLQLLAETGLVGFFSFFYLIIQTWRQARNQLRVSTDPFDAALAFGVLGALLSVLVHGTVDFFFQVSQQFGTLFWVLLALLVASRRLNARAGNGPAPVSSSP